ncbi:hypothetical protein LTR60_004870, partial [Cryomyces antarcticus]
NRPRKSAKRHRLHHLLVRGRGPSGCEPHVARQWAHGARWRRRLWRTAAGVWVSGWSNSTAAFWDAGRAAGAGWSWTRSPISPAKRSPLPPAARNALPLSPTTRHATFSHATKRKRRLAAPRLAVPATRRSAVPATRRPAIPAAQYGPQSAWCRISAAG